jgi:ABC-2 type transport system ATP-binding protein
VQIDASGLRKSFGALCAIDGVSFRLPAGCRTALVGPNGSGKSTLNRIVMGLLACEGDLLLDGRSPFRERVAIARRMAYAPQAAPQLAAPVGEVVRAVARVRALDLGGIAALARRFDLSLEALAPRPFRSLSGGMKQKLLLVLALSAETSLLVLDEPTGSLDASGRDRFFEIVNALPPETSVILCSHRLEEVRPLVGRVLMLEEGRLVYDGDAASFLDACTMSQIEVAAEGEQASEWLRDHGFRATAAGFWMCSVSQAEKLKLLRDLPAALGPALQNVNARDLEQIELARFGREARRG